MYFLEIDMIKCLSLISIRNCNEIEISKASLKYDAFWIGYVTIITNEQNNYIRYGYWQNEIYNKLHLSFIEQKR